MRRLAFATAVATATALATTLAGPLPGAIAQPAATTADRAAQPRYADFALRGSGFGSRVSGGQVPAQSSATAYMVISCTTRLGLDRENHQAEVTIPGLGRATAVKTNVWTREVGGVVSTYTRNSIGRLVVAQNGFGKLQVRAITSFAHAFHDASGFHAETATSIGSLEFVPPGGEPQELDLPSPGQPIEIPGLATISIGTAKKLVNHDGARAQANALIISKTASGTTATVGRANAQVLDGVKHGTFRGFSAGSSARGLDDNVSSGRTPLALMPCQGTGGEVLTRKIVGTHLGDNIALSTLQTQQMGRQGPGKSVAFERGSVAHFALGGDQLDIEGIVGKATVVRDGSTVQRSIKGTTVGPVTANGEIQEFPDTGVLEIPGLAKLERSIVTRTRFGIAVVALRITLLDGSGAVIDLGQARMAIRRH